MVAWGLPGVSYDLEALKMHYPKGMVKTPPGQPRQSAKNVVTLLNDAPWYDRLSRDASELIADVWDWD